MLRRSPFLFAVEKLKNNPKKLLFLGAPGVGKGTYATRLCRDTGYAHISTGDMLRHEVAEHTAIGLEAKRYMNQGDLVPSEVVEEMVKQRLLQLHKENRGFVLDGFPRNVHQAKAMDDYITIDYCVKLHQPFEVIMAKISGRRTCSECGEGYNLANVDVDGIKMEPLEPKTPGICDACGEPMSLLQRDDDKLDVVRHRLAVYVEETRPIEHNYDDIIHTFDIRGSTSKYYPLFLQFLHDRVHVDVQ